MGSQLGRDLDPGNGSIVWLKEKSLVSDQFLQMDASLRLTLSSARQRALVGLVARLFAVVAQPLRRGTDFGIMPNVTTFVARATSKRRHIDEGVFVTACFSL